MSRDSWVVFGNRSFEGDEQIQVTNLGEREKRVTEEKKDLSVTVSVKYIIIWGTHDKRGKKNFTSR